MRSLFTKSLTIAALTGGALLLAPTGAQAAPARSCHYVHQSTGANYGLLNGTQIYAPIDLGLDFTGNAVGILGAAHSFADHDRRITCGRHHHRHHRR